MKNYFLILVLLISFLIFSCGGEKNSKYKYELVYVDSLAIPIDSITSDRSLIRLYKDADSGEEFVALLNENINAIQLYSLETKSLTKIIRIPDTGSNKIGIANAFYIQSMDSIYIVDNYRYQMFLINEKAELLKRYSLLDPEISFNTQSLAPPKLKDNQYSGIPNAGIEAQIERIGDFLFLRIYPSYVNSGNTFYEKAKLTCRINVKTEELQYFLPFPKIYIESAFPTPYLANSIALNPSKEQLVFSFPADNNLVVYNKDMIELNKYPALSDIISKVEPLGSRDLPRAEQTKHAISNKFYKSLYFDSYRKVYHRLVWVPIESNEFGGYKIRGRSVMFDENFNKIGESKLKVGSFGNSVLATKNGLCFQVLSNEDYLVFFVYSLSKYE